jgi:hypothetical protein
MLLAGLFGGGWSNQTAAQTQTQTAEPQQGTTIAQPVTKSADSQTSHDTMSGGTQSGSTGAAAAGSTGSATTTAAAAAAASMPQAAPAAPTAPMAPRPAADAQSVVQAGMQKLDRGLEQAMATANAERASTQTRLMLESLQGTSQGAAPGTKPPAQQGEAPTEHGASPTEFAFDAAETSSAEALGRAAA